MFWTARLAETSPKVKLSVYKSNLSNLVTFPSVIWGSFVGLKCQNKFLPKKFSYPCIGLYSILLGSWDPQWFSASLRAMSDANWHFYGKTKNISFFDNSSHFSFCKRHLWRTQTLFHFCLILAYTSEYDQSRRETSILVQFDRIPPCRLKLWVCLWRGGRMGVSQGLGPHQKFFDAGLESWKSLKNILAIFERSVLLKVAPK